MNNKYKTTDILVIYLFDIKSNKFADFFGGSTDEAESCNNC